MRETSEQEQKPTGKKKNLALSVAAALFGVQSEQNRQQDFSEKSPWPFIAAGIVAIAIFIGLLLAIVMAVTATR
ncbi:hypothetical protein C942_03011 [Photobacterium marinum]|uniref:DUF2970 domain-containing protein n=1 Tax=Photobacterium marinum TaxID=1056511 RepID=L8J8Y3_9GAMM|nr:MULTISPECIES: DUF2970 domain-containing protein [Photobacterium]ELR63932.1 hypothetical protein C942_03011 [Photobacterium marinum]